VTTKEDARISAGAESSCTTNDNSLTGEQRGLIEKLRSISALIEQYRASIAMLEIERLKLQTALRLTGWRPPQPCGGVK
jgi:hypothetical protein